MRTETRRLQIQPAVSLAAVVRHRLNLTCSFHHLGREVGGNCKPSRAIEKGGKVSGPTCSPAPRLRGKTRPRSATSKGPHLFNLVGLLLFLGIDVGQDALQARLCAMEVFVEGSHGLADFVEVVLVHAHKRQRLAEEGDGVWVVTGSRFAAQSHASPQVAEMEPRRAGRAGTWRPKGRARTGQGEPRLRAIRQPLALARPWIRPWLGLGARALAQHLHPRPRPAPRPPPR